MESLKKVISLNQASKISGYNQDYLGYLIRSGEMKGIKKGRTWFTTEEEIKNYIFKKKIRHKKFALKEFLSRTRIKNIILATIFIFIIGFFVLSNTNKNKLIHIDAIKSAVTSDGGSIIISNINNNE